MTISLLNADSTGVVLLDVQEKLMPVMGRQEKVTENILRLLHLSKLYNLSFVLTEQYPKWLGSTLPEIKEVLSSYDPIEKLHFNCCDVDTFNSRLESEDLTNIILMGVESHICIFMTCISLLKKGYKIHVPQDAVDSRTDENWRVGLELMREAGALITSTETIIYQILNKAGTKEFKEMLKRIK
jgi:nicotinamidase-related amidase